MVSTTSSLNDAAFDFIVVGGATAGLMLVNRLTADPKVSVLVIEAGSDRLKDPRITNPELATTLYDDPTYDWSFNTVPQVRDSIWLSEIHVTLSPRGLTSGFRNRSISTVKKSVIPEAKSSEAQAPSMY